MNKPLLQRETTNKNKQFKGTKACISNSDKVFKASVVNRA